MKPGTSARNSSGTLNASHSQMNRAALSAESTKSTPPRCIGLLATMPTGCPSIRAKPTISSLAKSGLTSKKLPSSTSASMHLVHVVGARAPPPTARPPRSAWHPPSGACAGTTGRCLAPRGRQVATATASPRRWRPRRRRTRLSPHPLTVACMRAPPISSSVACSPMTSSAMRGEPEVHRRVPLDHEHHVAERRDVRAARGRRPEQAAHLRARGPTGAPGWRRSAPRRGGRGTAPPGR